MQNSSVCVFLIAQNVFYAGNPRNNICVIDLILYVNTNNNNNLKKIPESFNNTLIDLLRKN